MKRNELVQGIHNILYGNRNGDAAELITRYIEAVLKPKWDGDLIEFWFDPILLDMNAMKAPDIVGRFISNEPRANWIHVVKNK